MTTQSFAPESVATVDATDVGVARGSTTLDAAAVPYASAELVLPLLEDDLLDWLDPRAGGRRVPHTAGLAGVGSRSFDLGLRGRRVDHEAKSVTLTLASDEALLMDYRTLVADNGARAHETSLRAVCDYVLGKIGASLEAGTDDANVTAYWPVTNLVTNGSFETNAAGWANGSNSQGLGQNSSRAYVGSYCLIWQSVAAGVSFASMTDRLNVTPGRPYVMTARVGAGSARNVRLMVRWHNSAGTIVAADTYSAVVIAPAAGFTLATHLVTAPAGAVQASLHIEHQATAGAQNAFADMVMFYEGAEVIPEFNGDTPDTAQYNYGWAGAAHASASTRTPIVERLPEVFTIKPGVSLWDFLMVITSSAGVVLWCDEHRRWFLALPENRVIPTLVSIAEGNTSEGYDTLSLDDDATHATGVVVRYRWTDDDGAQREQYDTAGDPEKAMVIDLAQPYPGPGAAAAILARRQGSGRRQDVTTITQIGITPGMTAQISLPGAPDTIGRVQSVTFDHKTGFMDLSTAGLVDILPDSWDAWDPAETWDAVDPLLDWEEA